METYVDLRTQRRITALCCVLYLALGIARYNYSACLLAIVEAEAFSRATAGFIGTLSFFAFALGTALGGFVADRASSRRLILWAMLASGACNLVFYVTDSYPVMLVVWTLNGLAQGPIFSSVLHLLSDFYPRERVTGASVTVQCAFFVGVGAAYAVSALAIRFFTWREAFLAAALACALFSLVWNPVLKRAERQLPAAEEAGPARAAEAAKAQPAAGRTPGAWTLLRCAGLAFLPVPLLVQGILRDGITAWGPSYVGELFGLDESLAVASSMVIPLISILGIFASTYVRAWQRGNELRAAAAFFLFSTGLLAALVLTAGISLLPVMIGLFSFPEIVDAFNPEQRELIRAEKFQAREGLRIVWRNKLNIVRSALLGVCMGAIPGVGEDTGGWISYWSEKKVSKTPELWGRGCIDGVVASEAGNNAAVGGAIIPVLSLAIPGSAPAAVLLAAFWMHGYRPGTLMMQDTPNFLYYVVIFMMFASIIMWVIASNMSRATVRILQIDNRKLMPIIFICCVIGAFVVNNRLFDIYMMFFFGLLGVAMRYMKYPSAPFLLGVVLGNMADENLRRALILGNGDITPFFTRPISIFFLVFILCLVLPQIPPVARLGRKIKARLFPKKEKAKA